MISKRGFIVLGRWEAVSLLVLLCVAMPVKYILGYPLGVRIIGGLHGVLFLCYVGAALSLAQEDEWGWGKLMRCFVASCLPFGTFWFERELQLEA
jgi:integral membrane protein